ncbi:GTPase Der [Candidatus Methanoperedenaceae archaeon GB50]|nr:GTPase Der [Candidatus Methanoperedenaceae archaeon GB50]
MLEAPEGITDQDIKIINYAIACGKCILIVVNKWDLMPTTSKFKREYIENIRQRLRFASFLPVITVSALKGEGLKQIFAMLNTLYQEYTLRISTGQLNRFVEEIWGKYQPPLYQNRPIKLYYITQVDIKPPTFVIFTNYPQAIPENYKRFLVNQLHQLGFKYIPLKLLFRERRRS